MTALHHGIRIQKQALKFSCAHFTVFSQTQKEALHGHNYTTRVQAQVAGTGLDQMVPFELIKKPLKLLCDEWDERVLLPKLCPYLRITQETQEQLDFTVAAKRYSLPKDEVAWVEVDNITTENLAAALLVRLKELLRDAPALRNIQWLEVGVEESPGQGAFARWEPKAGEWS